MNVTKECKNIYLGNTPIKKVFAGNDLVWRKNLWSYMSPMTVDSDGNRVSFELAQIIKDEVDKNANSKTSYNISTVFTPNINKTIRSIIFTSIGKRAHKEFFTKYEGLKLSFYVTRNAPQSVFDADNVTFKLKSNNDTNNVYIFTEENERYFEPFAQQKHNNSQDYINVSDYCKNNLYLMHNTMNLTINMKEVRGFKPSDWEDVYNLCRKSYLKMSIIYNE